MGFLSRIQKASLDAAKNMEQGISDAMNGLPSLGDLSAMAHRAMVKILEASVRATIKMASDAATWYTEEFKVPIPYQETFDKAQETLNKIPLVGPPMANKIQEQLDSVAKTFVDALVVVANSDTVITIFVAAITGLKADDIIGLCTSGLNGPALATFLEDKCGGEIKLQMRPLVDDILKTHPVTKAWSGLVDAYNAAASKLPFATTIELDLPGYLLESFMQKSGEMLKQNENKIKKESQDDDIFKLFGEDIAAGATAVADGATAGATAVAGGVTAGATAVADGATAGATAVAGGVTAGATAITDGATAGATAVAGGVTVGATAAADSAAAVGGAAVGGATAGASAVAGGVNAAGGAAVALGGAAAAATGLSTKKHAEGEEPKAGDASPSKDSESPQSISSKIMGNMMSPPSLSMMGGSSGEEPKAEEG